MSRRYFTAEQKAQIVRRHLADKVPVSKLAEELHIQPSQLHGWVNVVLAQAERAFERTGGPPRREQAQLTAKVERLEARLVQKNEVIAELLEENVKAKKEAGEL